LAASIERFRAAANFAAQSDVRGTATQIAGNFGHFYAIFDVQRE